MSFTKTITFDYTITDVASVFSNDIDASILYMLNKSGKHCNRGCLILEYKRIVNRSAITINMHSMISQFVVSLTVEIEAIQYEKGDLLVGKIHDILTNNDIILINDNFKATIQRYPIRVNVGDKIPFYVTDSKYDISKTHVSLLGVPFVKLKYEICYKITTPIDQQEYMEYLDYAKPYLDQLAVYEKSHSKATSYFKKMLNSSQKQTGNKLTDLYKKSIGDTIYRDESNILQPTFNTGLKNTVVEGTGMYIAERLIRMYIGDLRNLVNLLANYCDDYDSNKVIWELYKNT